MKKIVLAMAIAFIGIVVFAIGASAEVREGKWSMTIVTKMDGMGNEAAQEMQNMSPEDRAMMEQMMGGMGMGVGASGAGITTTTTTCVTNDNPVPETNLHNCQHTHSMQGNTVNFQSVCEDGTSTGQMTYENDSMRGTITSQQMLEGRQTNSTIEITGQYVGPCDG